MKPSRIHIIIGFSLLALFGGTVFAAEPPKPTLAPRTSGLTPQPMPASAYQTPAANPTPTPIPSTTPAPIATTPLVTPKPPTVLGSATDTATRRSQRAPHNSWLTWAMGGVGVLVIAGGLFAWRRFSAKGQLLA